MSDNFEIDYEKIWAEAATYEIWQKKEEFIYLLREAAKHKLSGISLEIGTAQGASALALSKVAGEVITIDKDFRHRLGSNSKGINFVTGVSYSEGTLQKAKDILGGRPIDTLFIDGTHFFDSCKKDFEQFSGLVRPGGVIALHDIVDSRKQRNEMVWVRYFWDYLKKNYNNVCKFKEVIVPDISIDAEEEWAGIGLMFLPE